MSFTRHTHSRNTHPLVLTAAAAVTVFSVLGSAIVTGLIPVAWPEKSASAQGVYATMPPADAVANVMSLAAEDGKLEMCRICGIVESISLTRIDGSTSGVGAIAGGFAGGIVIFRPSHDDKPLTIISKDGRISQQRSLQDPQAPTTFVVTVRMANGSVQTITQSEQPHYDVGDPVKVFSGTRIAV